MQDSVYNAFFGGKPRDLDYHCTTGECTWGDYQSLAVCSQCANVTDLVRVEHGCDPYFPCLHWHLPNDLSIDMEYDPDHSGELINFSIIGPIRLKDLDLSIVSFARLDTSGETQDPLGCAVDEESCLEDLKRKIKMSATECALFWCVNKYTARTNSARIMEDSLASWWNRNTTLDFSGYESSDSLTSLHKIQPPSSGSSDKVPTENTTGEDCTLGTYSQDFPRTNQNSKLQSFYIEPNAHGSLVSFFGSLFDKTTQDRSNPIISKIFQDVGPFGDISQTGGNSEDLTPQLFLNLSNSITQGIRRFDNDPPSAPQDFYGNCSVQSQGVAYAIGSTIAYQIVVSVRWEWIIFPVILVAFTVSLTLATVVCGDKRGIPVWKSSTLTLILQDPLWQTSYPKKVDDIVDIEKVAGHVKVSLKKSEAGWRLCETAVK